MKLFTAVLASILLLACCQAVQGALSVQPRTLQRRASPGLLRASPLASLDCGGTTSSCADCTTTLTCARVGNTYRAVSTSTCPTATPYCMAGQCVATMADQSCNQPPAPTNTFVCNGEGYFPDPSSCTRYYLCVNGNAYQYDCSAYSGTVYSHARAMCVPRAEVGSCPVTSCTTALVGKYQQYTVDRTVYFVCTDTSASNALVAACPANYTIDTTTTSGECKLTCTDEGRLADSSNSQHYYECIKLGTNRFSGPLPQSCPDGSTYSQQQQRCVSGSSPSPTPTPTSYPDEDFYAPNSSVPESMYNIPTKVLVGSATASYQIEGAWNEDGKSPNIWDVYFHSRPTMDNGDVACDSYHKWREDIALLKELGMETYRFSLSWPRLLPTGGSDNVNQLGVQYYHNIIDELKANGIEPLVTMYHWDLPQIYQDDGGWLNSAIVDRFVDFATFAFQEYGADIKYWMLFNEPNIFCQFGYEGTNFAPGVGQTGTGGYGCVHNMILAHAKSYRVYESQFKAQYGGQVGSAIALSFQMPLNANSEEDKAAAERSMEFSFAWFVDPLVLGDYPAVMRQTVDANSQAAGTASRLPSFTAEEKTIIKGTMDFIGVNHYSTSLVTTGTGTLTSRASMTNDTNVAQSIRAHWLNSVNGPLCPWGLRGVLNWVHKRYNAPPIMITENGYGNTAAEDTLQDDVRVSYYSGYMRAAMRAVNEDGVNLIGYTAWSLMDNLEWSSGYDKKFGMVRVDFSDPDRTRTIKESGRFVRDAIASRSVSYVAIPSPQ